MDAGKVASWEPTEPRKAWGNDEQYAATGGKDQKEIRLRHSLICRLTI
jgi:hypothetical protein